LLPDLRADDAILPFAECTTEQSLAVALRINRRGVEKSDTLIQRGRDQRRRNIVTGSQNGAKPTAAQAERKGKSESGSVNCQCALETCKR
jgi:hypothetical protein